MLSVSLSKTFPSFRVLVGCYYCDVEQFLREEAERITHTNIVICTPGRLLQHMDETYNFTADALQIVGQCIILYFYVLFNDALNTFLINAYISIGNILIEKIPSGYLTGIDLRSTACQMGAYTTRLSRRPVYNTAPIRIKATMVFNNFK